MFDKLAHLFVPHHTNNHKPKVLHHHSLLFLTAAFLFLQATINFIQLKAPGVLGYASQIPPSRIIELTNQKRASAGLPPLSLDERLSDAARRKAADMFSKNYWAHNAPDGTKPWNFILAAGYSYLHAGENLARDFNNPDAVVDAWMNSPTHRDNLLNSKYQNIGVAVVDGQLTGSETTLVVQMFGTLQVSTPKVSSDSVVKPVLAETSQKEEPKVIASAPTPVPTVEAIPTIIPTAVPTPEVITQVKTGSKPLLGAFELSRFVSALFAVFVMAVLLLDWVIAWQKNLIRISGRNWAHLTYLAFVLFLSIIIKQGLIL